MNKPEYSVVEMTPAEIFGDLPDLGATPPHASKMVCVEENVESVLYRDKYICPECGLDRLDLEVQE